MMLYRAIWVVREGRTFDEAMELFKQFPTGGPKAVRVLASRMGSPQAHTLTFDFEFADTSACEKGFSEWLTELGGHAFMAKWYTLCEQNSSRAELWQVLQ